MFVVFKRKMVQMFTEQLRPETDVLSVFLLFSMQFFDFSLRKNLSWTSMIVFLMS